MGLGGLSFIIYDEREKRVLKGRSNESSQQVCNDATDFRTQEETQN